MIGWDKKIARAHDASGIDNISVYMGQTIPEAETAYSEGLRRSPLTTSPPFYPNQNEILAACLKYLKYEFSVEIRNFVMTISQTY